jgi:hypothetical protein
MGKQYKLTKSDYNPIKVGDNKEILARFDKIGKRLDAHEAILKRNNLSSSWEN